MTVLAQFGTAAAGAANTILPIVLGAGNIITRIAVGAAAPIPGVALVGTNGVRDVTAFNVDLTPNPPDEIQGNLYTLIDNTPGANVIRPGPFIGFPLFQDSNIYLECLQLQAPLPQCILPIMIEYYGEAAPSQN